MSISLLQRQFVRDRAGHCCEYCRLLHSGSTAPFHVDHIIPLKHDGSNDDSNLCLACFECNAHKSHDLTGFDPATGAVTRLYHPRKQRWSDHFELGGDMQITGLTPEGRTTVRVLQINHEDRVEMRQVLAEVGEYPCPAHDD